VGLKTTCIKNVKFKIVKTRTGCKYRILLLQRKPKLGRTKRLTGPHAGSGLDIAGMKLAARVMLSLRVVLILPSGYFFIKQFNNEEMLHIIPPSSEAKHHTCSLFIQQHWAATSERQSVMFSK